MEAIASLDSTALDDVPPELLKVPNCIPCALWHVAASQDKESYLQAFLQPDTQQNLYSIDRKCRTYQQCVEVLQTLDLKPSLGVVCTRRANIHCVSLEVQEAGDVMMSVIKDGSKEYRLEASSLLELAEGSTDFSTIVSFGSPPKMEMVLQRFLACWSSRPGRRPRHP